MSSVRRCDACGAIGVKPYDGWLRVTSFAKDEAEKGSFGIGVKPRLSFDVCSHACLPTLAFERSDVFAAAADEA